MGNSTQIRNSVVNIPDVARVQNTEHHRDDAQRQQTAMAMQKESAIKETQVQTSPKAESAEINKKQEKKLESENKKNRKKKPSYKTLNTKVNDSKDEENHVIDLKI
jgi:hypothetical protein